MPRQLLEEQGSSGASSVAEAPGNFRSILFGVAERLGQIDGREPAVAHQHLPVDDRRVNVGGRGGVDDRGLDGIYRLRFGRLQVDDGDVGALSRLESSAFPMESESACAAD